MNVYIYAAELWCEECGAKVCKELDAKGEAPEDSSDESSYDSDDYPKGPTPTNESESDAPLHCAGCGRFLEPLLTDEGIRYVREAIERAIIEDRADNVALTEWAPYYGIEPEDPRAVRLARMNPRLRKLANEDGELPGYTWPGGYPIFYVTGKNAACAVCCVKCANDADTGVEAFGYGAKIHDVDINWEDPDLYCECGDRIESAYAVSPMPAKGNEQ
jgi:hypothetical protein